MEYVFTWDNLGHLADTLGVVTALPLLAAAAYFWSRAQRYRRRLRHLAGVTRSGRGAGGITSRSQNFVRSGGFCTGCAQPMPLYECRSVLPDASEFPEC